MADSLAGIGAFPALAALEKGGRVRSVPSLMSKSAISLVKLAALAAVSLLTPAFGAVVSASFDTAATVPVTATGYTATGNTAEFTLNFAPTPGSTLTVVKNTGNGFIGGEFDNLAQGQVVNLTYNGVSYPLVANYYGGTGNDLTLQWANVRPFGWGYNTYGNLSDGTSTDQWVPVPVVPGALAGKTILQLVAGRNTALTLTADGALVAWGGNPGNGATSTTQPVLVDRSGVLAGKSPVAIATGSLHGLVLCKDGTLAAWGVQHLRPTRQRHHHHQRDPGGHHPNRRVGREDAGRLPMISKW